MALNLSHIKKEIADIKALYQVPSDLKYLKLLFNLIDLTSLNTTDNIAEIIQLCSYWKEINHDFPSLGHMAGICVFPIYIRALSEHIYSKDIKKVTVSGNFPFAQTPMEISLREIEWSVAQGADEIDIVLSPGLIKGGDLKQGSKYISSAKKICNNVLLKVILETGILADECLVEDTAFLAMEAGADFIKTSTGKVLPAATPEAVYVMSHCIKLFNKSYKKKVGIKPAGGISTVDDAGLYLKIIETQLGQEWINPRLTRIGASSLAKQIIENYKANRQKVPERDIN